MKRRNFVKLGAVGSAGLLACSPKVTPVEVEQAARPATFKLKFAPHIGMFKHHAGEDVLDQLRFMADQGFTAFEDNNLKRRDPALQEKMGSLLSTLGMEMGVFVGGRVQGKNPTIVRRDPEMVELFLADIRESIVASKRVNAKWMTTIPGRLDLRTRIDWQTAQVIDVLRRACELLEPHGLVMVLEPLNFFNHPGFFLSEIPQTYQICRAVDSPSCKILFDIYHQQIQEGNLIPNIDAAWDEIAYFQIGDNPGRKEPGTGEINYKNIFEHIHKKGFKGIYGMEHSNFNDGIEGERALLAAYRSVDLDAEF